MQQDNQLKDNSDSGSNNIKDYDIDNSNFGKEEDGGNSHSEQNNKVKKKYSVITQEVREKFIKRVISREVTIKEAAKEFGIKFSTSKAILQTYKREGRIGKKKTRQRRPSHSEQENVGNSQHSPKNPPQTKSTNKSSTTGSTNAGVTGEESQKQATGNTQKQHSASTVNTANPLYRNAMTHQMISGLELSDPTMMDTEMKNTIYEMQATIQDGFPIFDPNIQTPILHPALLKQGGDSMIHHPNFSIDQLAHQNKIQGSMIGSMGQQVPSMYQGYQMGHQPQNMYPGAYYGHYGYPQNPNYPQYQHYYSYQHPQMMYQMPQQHMPQNNGLIQQKIPRRMVYSNPYNTNQTTPTTESQGPTYANIKDQLKNIHPEQLRINSQQYVHKDIDRDMEFNYQKYYQQ